MYFDFFLHLRSSDWKENLVGYFIVKVGLAIGQIIQSLNLTEATFSLLNSFFTKLTIDTSELDFGLCYKFINFDMYAFFFLLFITLECEKMRWSNIWIKKRRWIYFFTLVIEVSTSRSSRKNAPKKGTTGHSGIAKARDNARSYSEDRRADERYSNTGNCSFTLCQNGFNFGDLKHKLLNQD